MKSVPLLCVLLLIKTPSHYLYLLKAIFSMNAAAKLTLIKIIHTLIWLFFNIVIFYMLYAVVANKIDKWLWIGYSLFIAEGLVLLAFKFFCPLTILARKYSNSTNDNFDIFLPNWLARHNKTIYTSILLAIFILTVVRLIYG